MEIETSALKIAYYEFTDNYGKLVQTSKLIISLGDFGTYTCCTPLANDIDILSKCKAVIAVNNYNKIVIKSIEK